MLRSKLFLSGLAVTLSSSALAQTVTTFCAATNNSTGTPAVLTGSFGSGVGSDLHLEVSGGVPNEIGYFLAGNEATSGVVISEGINCLIGTSTAQVFRYNVGGTEAISIGRFNGLGVLENLVGTSTTGTGFDVPAMIPSTTPIPILFGDTWHFQLWYRDTVVASNNSNLSNGLSVMFNYSNSPNRVTDMVLIRAGTFRMGSDAVAGPPYNGNLKQKPVHDVTISQAFLMGKHEVTQAEYQAVMGTNPSTFSGPNLPVEKVSWYDAVAYCTALTALERAAGSLQVGYEYRLPTEAEWEYACRAETTTEFNVGTDLYCSQARFWYSYHPSGNYCGVSSSAGTIDVGSYSANTFGLYDMHGSVWEWCLDSYASYNSAAVTDPFVPGGSDRVLRGGSWHSLSSYCRSASRFSASLSTSSPYVGFRVVLAQENPQRAGMVLIPAGTFSMGTDVGGGAPYYGSVSESQPVHGVTISQAFLMGKHEVTQAEYLSVMGSNPSYFAGTDLPVEQVSWNDAVAYCTALTAQEMALGNLQVGYEYRLPTEAEWEYACRAGTTTEFNVGTDLDCADARFDYSFHGNGSCGISSAAGTIDVGSYPANAFGLHDMHGNVMEWCLDNYSLYSSGAVTDPFVAGSPGRVFRGGSWAHSSDVCRSASRHVWNPNNSNRRVGFRVVLAPENPQRAGMVLIPAGTFSMGSDAPTGLPYNNNLNQQPVHYVTISQDFWMGEHEVTQAEYQALMGSNPSHYFGPNLPVEQVSWNDAVAYCTVLTAQEMAAGNLQTGYEYRLPKEAEWEYACRAGTTTEFNVGSDLFCSQARFSYSYHPSGNHCGVSTSAGTIDVGAYFPNDFGLYDMHGNVWEWCLDSYASYNSAPVTDPFVTGGSNRVIRGGSWNSPSSYCRSACRFSTNSGSSSLYVGFRVVLAPENPPPAGMVLIPAGTFSMGSDAPTGLPYNNSSNQQPVHDVTISQDFWMGEHEVTQAEYQALMSTNPSYFSGPGLPVETVSWHDARAYCTALTAQQMAAGDLPAGYEYRLPTEAEWEYACRAETTTEFNVGSDLFCSQARFWYSYHPSGNSCGVNSSAATIDVGSYLANDFGLYDMHGSVWEWCLDSYASYGAAAVTDPFVTGGSSRVIRGGSWYNVSYHCRSAYRSGSNPGNAYDNFGFRVVLAPVLVP